MSWRHLGETFDIHGGGIDLAFPHHENELAQSRCAHGTDVMARYWMHNGFLQVEGQKMSKSLGNFITIHELLATDKFGGRKWPGEVLRLAMLMTHYRQPIDWTAATLREALMTLRKWGSSVLGHDVHERQVSKSVLSCITDDLNTPAAIAEMHKLARRARSTSPSDEPHSAGLQLLWAMEHLGFGDHKRLLDDLSEANQALDDAIDKATVELLITARLEARKRKDFAKSDSIRDELGQMGIQLKDGKDPATGEPITTWEIKR